MIARTLAAPLASMFIALSAAPPAQAGTCADILVEARGEQSRFMWSAKGKARANWRSKVRRTPGLGAGFANWARAENTEERCFSGPLGVVCIFKGKPCLP